MLPDGQPSSESAEPTVMLRHTRVPVRVFGLKLIVARPRDGAPVVLGPTAAFVWRLLDEWTSSGELDRRLADAHPEVANEDRVMTRTEILGLLQDDDLIERS